MDPNQLPPELMEAAQSRGLDIGGGMGVPQPGAAPQGQATQAPPAPQPVTDPMQGMQMGLPAGSVEAQIIEGALIDRLKSISKQEEMKLKPPTPEPAPTTEVF